MPRQRRCWRPQSGQHVISRFVDRRFHLNSSSDRKAYLRYVCEAQGRWDWRWMSYALMSSHVHAGLLAGSRSPESFYRSTHTRFAQRFHRRNPTIGPVFSGRPKMFEVAPSKLARMVAYHHRNPVEAGTAKRPRDSRWTSHRAFLRLDPAPPFLDVEWALHSIGFDDSAAGRRIFDEFVCDFDFDTYHEALREKDARSSIAVTTAQHRLEAPAVEELLLAVANLFALKVAVVKKGNSRVASHARRIFAHIAVNILGSTVTSAAEALGQRRTAIANLLTRSTAMSSELLSEQTGRVLARLSR